jgi:hypothetical protein
LYSRFPDHHHHDVHYHQTSPPTLKNHFSCSSSREMRKRKRNQGRQTRGCRLKVNNEWVAHKQVMCAILEEGKQSTHPSFSGDDVEVTRSTPSYLQNRLSCVSHGTKW